MIFQTNYRVKLAQNLMAVDNVSCYTRTGSNYRNAGTVHFGLERILRYKSLVVATPANAELMMHV